jgi:hypothetical protein
LPDVSDGTEIALSGFVPVRVIPRLLDVHVAL